MKPIAKNLQHFNPIRHSPDCDRSVTCQRSDLAIQEVELCCIVDTNFRLTSHVFGVYDVHVYIKTCIVH